MPRESNNKLGSRNLRQKMIGSFFFLVLIISTFSVVVTIESVSAEPYLSVKWTAYIGARTSIPALAADIAYRYDKFEDSMKYVDMALKMRPNGSSYLVQLSNCFRGMAEQAKTAKEKLKFINEARQVLRFCRAIHKQTEAECANWIFRDNALLPFEGE